MDPRACTRAAPWSSRVQGGVTDGGVVLVSMAGPPQMRRRVVKIYRPSAVIEEVYLGPIDPDVLDDLKMVDLVFKWKFFNINNDCWLKGSG